jgi:glycosyltransferase involved in cell wall biosynthesis
MDVVALTSRNEGTPVSVIEALAAGVPVVATAVGGVPDVIRHEENGILIPAGDPVALAAALERLTSDVHLRERVTMLGRREAGQKFGHDRLVSDIAALYSGLLKVRAERS